MGASTKACASSDKDDRSDSPWEREQDQQIEDGILGQEEKGVQRTLKITEECCVLEAPEDTTNSNEIMQSAVVNSDSSQQGSMIDTLEDRLIQLQPRQLQHRQVTHMLYNKKR